MEYPPLVAGQSVRFAVHLTNLGDFSALNAGRPNIVMTPEGGGAGVTLPGSDPLRPGAFRVEGTIPPAGRYRWVLNVDAPGLVDRHDLGQITVFADQAAAVADAETRAPDDASTISYLKEQQWTNEFATHLVIDGDVRSAIRVPANVEPVTGGEAIVPAPAAGRFLVGVLPSVGDRVSAGAVLGRIEPRLDENGADHATLEAGTAEAQSALEAARADLARAEGLLADRAVPARRVEDARRAVGVAEARLRAAQARLAQRDEVLRKRWGRGLRERLCPARADCRSRRRGSGRAWRHLRRRRAALPNRPDRPRRAPGAAPAERRGARADPVRPGARSTRASRSDRAEAGSRARCGGD